MADLGALRIEIQVRTLAQHIWAAASHKLQYKHEESVPPPIRRTINRVSALLEIVDLEFDRVLEERRDYRDVGIPAAIESEPLNVDLLASLLNDVFPEANREDDEDYAELLMNMKELSIGTMADLKSLLQEHIGDVMESERALVLWFANLPHVEGRPNERRKRGVAYTHVGLARTALRHEFGDDVLYKIVSKQFSDDSDEVV